MKILDRYILQRVLSTFFFVVLILMSIITVIDITEKMDKFAKNNLETDVILAYYLDFLPWVAGLITPITIFIAIIYVTSRLAGHTEIISILSGGISFRRFLLPYFLASAVIASISFVLNGWVIPAATKSRLDFEMRYFNGNRSITTQHIHLQIAPSVYLFIKDYNSSINTGFQFTLERFQDNVLMEKLTAETIVWDTTKRTWTLTLWKIHRINDVFSSASTDRRDFMTYGQLLDTALAISPKDFENTVRGYEGMTTPELEEHIAKLKFRGATGVATYEVERHIRLAAPFTTFILVFMGVTVSSRKSRGGTGLQIALGFVLAFIFILFFLLSRRFAETGGMNPVLAAWTPNLIFTIVSGVLYRFTPR